MSDAAAPAAAGRGNIVMTVDTLSRQRDEQGAGHHRPGVGCQGGDYGSLVAGTQTAAAPSAVAISSTVTGITASCPADRPAEPGPDAARPTPRLPRPDR